MAKQLNAVRVNCSTAGMGTTLALGAAVSAAFQTAAAAGALAGENHTITIDDGTQREITTGTIGAGATTIDRAATPIWSSTGARLDLSGSATISFGPSAGDLNTPDLFGTPAAPGPGLVRLGESPLAGLDFPSWRSNGVPERFMNPLLSRTKWEGVSALTTGVSLIYYNFANTQFTNTGFGNGGSFSSADYANRQLKSTFSTTATVGNVASMIPNGAAALRQFVGGSNAGGFLASFRFAFTAQANPILPTSTRAFIGLGANASGAQTNVNPSTLVNSIGVARVDGSNNLNIVFGGSTAQTPIDLGANFPVFGGITSFYELLLFSDPNDNSRVGYTVNRWNGASNVIVNTISGWITNTTPGTTLPATSTAMGPNIWLSNNSDAASASMTFSSYYAWSE